VKQCSTKIREKTIRFRSQNAAKQHYFFLNPLRQ